MRKEAKIMDDILTAYCNLSPENLSCDGELSRSEQDFKARQIQAKLKSLFKELGREVSEMEAYGYEEEQRELRANA